MTTVEFAPAERRTSPFGLRYGQWLIGLLGVAAVVAGPLLGGPAGFVAGFTVMLIAFVSALRPTIGGDYLDEWLPVAMRNTWRAARGRTVHNSQAPESGFTSDGVFSQEVRPPMPPTMDGIRIIDAKVSNAVTAASYIGDHHPRVAVLHDDTVDGYSAVMRIHASPLVLADDSDVEQAAAAWDQVLAACGAPSSAIRRVQLLDVAASDEDGTQLHRDYAARSHLDPSDPAAASYLRLLDDAGPVATVHDTFLALQIDASRVARARRKLEGPNRDAAMTRVLVDEMNRVAAVAVDNGLHVTDRFLSPRELARAVSYAYDPMARVHTEQRDDQLPAAGARGVSWENAFPLHASAKVPDRYVCERAVHRTYWFTGWPTPRASASLMFLQPLLLEARQTRRFSMVMDPLHRATELQAAQERAVLAEVDAEQRSRRGFATSEERRRLDEQRQVHIEEMADQATPYRFSGWVTVSSPGRDWIDHDSDGILEAAARSMCELKRMDRFHDVAFTYTLPGVMRGLRGWR